MRTKLSQMTLALVACATFAAPLAVSAHPLGSPRHSDGRGRPENRYHEPSHRSQPNSRCFWSVPPPCPQPVVVYPGYYAPPPPPPPMACWGYYPPPPPPPPPPPVCYPRCPRPAFSFVFSF